jgi:hypothetical protein
MKNILKGTNISISNILDVAPTSNTHLPDNEEKIPSAEETQKILLSMEAEKNKKNREFVNNLQSFSKKVGNNPNDENDNMDIENPNNQSGGRGKKQQSGGNPPPPPPPNNNGDNGNPPPPPPDGNSNNENGNTPPPPPPGGDGNGKGDNGNPPPPEGDPNYHPDNQPPQDDQQDGNNGNTPPPPEDNPIAMSDDSVINIEINKISSILEKELDELKEALKMVKDMKKNIESNMTVNAEQVSQAQAECETFRAYFGLPNFFDNIYMVTEDDINNTPLLTYRLIYKQYLNSIRIVLSDYMDS